MANTSASTAVQWIVVVIFGAIGIDILFGIGRVIAQIWIRISWVAIWRSLVATIDRLINVSIWSIRWQWAARAITFAIYAALAFGAFDM